jgi:cytochrome c peroxidase
MKNNQYKIFITGLVVALTFVQISCSGTDDYQELQPLVSVPDNFPPYVDSQTNPLSRDGIALGKKLFFDTTLSGNNTVSCASCHLPQKGFTDGLALSNLGISGNTLHRNSPTLVNLAWANNGLFWDGGSTNLESQAFAPLAHPDEMFQNLNQLVQELKSNATYVSMFEKAFKQEVTQSGIVKALAQFQRTLISSNSRYDKFIRNESDGTMTEEELDGLDLAQQFCFSCHTSPLFTDNLYHNNGLDSDFSDTSFEGMLQGRFRVTNNTNDLGKFKTPTLRNVEVTAPYMHDGRLSTLDDVLNHYASGVVNSPTLDTSLNHSGTLGIPLTSSEKAKIIAFLKTLTDNQFLNDTRFSE